LTVPELPIARPGKIVCVGLNYRTHAVETGAAIPDAPLLFAKFPSSLIGPGAAIRIPDGCDQVDFEAELGVVIGTRAVAVSRADALDFVRGYVAINDVTDRAAQFGDGQWVRGKSYDTFAPVGPALVPADEIPDPQALAIRCRVNGDLVQDATTADMIFDVATLVSYISDRITLDPGDLIATGTPSGVGYTRSPQLFLHPGDEVSVEIEGVGVLSNPVVVKR
jgi:2,4-didehydro-3-deoxy-L-rhamnonate hydrolase